MTHPSALLRELSARAKKSFGQHFLANPDTVYRIVAFAGVQPGQRVLEIGPGLGILTEALLSAGAHVTAVEKDRDLAAFLAERLAAHVEEGRLRVVCADAKLTDYATLLPGSGWWCVSNLPYNVGTALVLLLLGMPQTLSRQVVMLQREVAERMAAPPGARNRGSLSAAVQARAVLTPGLRLPPGAFYPPPKVESAVIALDTRPVPDTDGVPLPTFDETARRIFNTPRKTLRRILVDAYGERGEAALDACGLDPTLRPATLSGAEIARLARALCG